VAKESITIRMPANKGIAGSVATSGVA